MNQCGGREKNNLVFVTMWHFLAPFELITSNYILILVAGAAYTHFRGGVMGSNADFMENGLKPERFIKNQKSA